MKIIPANIDWQEIPKAQDFGDVFFAQGSFAEVKAVFIEPNNLVERFVDCTGRGVFSIGETGFASGLSFLSVVKVWLETSSSALYEPRTSQLHFYSVEKFPWQKSDLARWYKNHPLEDLAQELIANYPPLIAGWHRVHLFNNLVVLHLYFGEAMSGFASLNHKIDAWFLDGFAPDKNPEMWSVNLFKQLRRLSKIGTSLATFTAAGFVRRNLIEAGFAVEKIKGFAGKREMLRGQVEQDRNFSSKTPWYLPPYPASKVEEVGIVGAGLAGAAIAFVLAEKGIQVKVFEEQSEPALGASGNISGLLYPVFTADWSRRSQWYWQGLQTSLRYLKPLVEAQKVAGNLSGCVIIPPTQEQKDTLERCLDFLPSEIIEKISAEKASELMQVGGSKDAFHIKYAGWVSPKDLVRELLQHQNIELITSTKPEIKQIDSGWELGFKEKSWQFSDLVLTTGAWEEALAEANLDLRRLKGQVTHLSADSVQDLKLAVSHRGYTAPAQDGFVTGASFVENFTKEDLISANKLSKTEQDANLVMVQEALPDWLLQKETPLAGRGAVRAMSPDHLPLVGRLVNSDFLQENYLSQSNNLAPYKYPRQEYISGLYVSNGHGARGLTSVFLAAEVIAGELLGPPYLEDENLYQASHTARFALRAWQKSSIQAVV